MKARRFGLLLFLTCAEVTVLQTPRAPLLPYWLPSLDFVLLTPSVEPLTGCSIISAAIKVAEMGLPAVCDFHNAYPRIDCTAGIPEIAGIIGIAVITGIAGRVDSNCASAARDGIARIVL